MRRASIGKDFNSSEDSLDRLDLEEYDPAFFENQILDVKQVAEYLKVATKTIYRMAPRGEIPAARIGKTYRFYLPDIVRWLQSGGNNENRR